MKKMFAALLVASLLVPASAMAVDTFTAEQIKDGSDLISTLSNKVSLMVASGGNAYAAASGHESGNKIFASTSNDTKIFVMTASTDPLSLSTDAAISDSDTAQFSDWDAL